MRYLVKRYHKIGPREYCAGEVLEIDDPAYAAWLNRDMRGNLEQIIETSPPPVPEARMIETPPHDRMVRTRKKRTQA